MITAKLMASAPARMPVPSPVSQSQVVRELARVWGRKLTAYAGGAKDSATVDRWISGDALDSEAVERLRIGFDVTKILLTREPASLIQACFCCIIFI